jgi:hypothetical protein
VAKEVFKANGMIVNAEFRYVKAVEWRHYNKHMEAGRNDSSYL